MIDTVTPAPRTRRTRTAVAGFALLAVLAAGVAVLAAGDDPPRQLALALDTHAAGLEGEAMRAGAPASLAAEDAAAPGTALMHPGWYGVRFEVEGDLPELGGRAAAWKVVPQAFDQGRFARLAEALGLEGDIVRQERGFALETARGSLHAHPAGGEGWWINFHRPPVDGADVPAKESSGAEAEAIARRLLDGLGALPGEWRTERHETEIGFGYACPMEREVASLEAEKLAVSGAPAPDDCPPPAPPVKAWNVSFSPVLDGVRTDWTPWGVTVSAAGRVEHLYGSFTRLEPAGDFPLRGTGAALEELRAQEGGGGPALMPMPLAEPMPSDLTSEPVSDAGSTATGSSGAGDDPARGAPTMEILPAPAPDPAFGCRGDGCTAPPPVERAEPAVVTITGVERALTAIPVYQAGDTMILHLVPAYRFIGRMETGDRWETTVVALHPDAIAPPPMRIMDGGTVDGGSAPAVEPAVDSVESHPVRRGPAED